MLLAIDSGNTNVVFAIYDGETQRGRWRASSDPDRTADEYAVWLTQLMALEALTPGDVDGAVLANVVPAARYALETLCRRYFGTEPTIIDAPGVDLGVEVRTGNAMILDCYGRVVSETASPEDVMVAVSYTHLTLPTTSRV